MSSYEHVQTGTVILLVVVPSVAGGLVLLVLTLHALPAPALSIVVAVLLLLMVVGGVFRSMSVRVDDRGVKVWVGSGLIHRTIPREEIASCEATRRSWLWGYGIRWTPQGWLWRVSGVRAVAIRLKSGRTFFIGTDEPQALVAAIRDVSA